MTSVLPAPVAPRARARARGGVGLGLGAVVAAGAGLRVWALGTARLNYDESFTAIAGRMPFGALARHLRLADSHPPLDYLLRAPIARAGASETFVRLPSALCSIAALALFAWWMRDRGRAGLLATLIMAMAAFQLAYGREARMYADLQLIGVATAVVVDSWLRAPRRWHSWLAGALTAVALLTHVSGALLAAGLLLVPGRRRDRDAWRWRASVALGGLLWAALWGPSFLTQTRGGHSQWIPRSTLNRAVAVVASLVSPYSAFALLVVAVVVAGGVILGRRDRTLARTWLACFVVPVGLAIVIGRVAPVLLDRSLTLFAWGVPLAVAMTIDVVTPRRTVASGLALSAVLALMVSAALHTVTSVNGPTRPIDHLRAVANAGDIVAIEPSSKAVELQWSLGVRSRQGPTRVVRLNVARTPALELTAAPRSGRVWLLDFNGSRPRFPTLPRCAPDWTRGSYRIECLTLGSAPGGPGSPAGGLRVL